MLKSTSYLEFINELDNLVYELLYSQNGGYINLDSKDAVVEAKNIIEKFSYEASKIRKKVDFENADSIVKDKHKELLNQVEKHYNKEAIQWADNVYQDMIENCLMGVSINKEDKESTDKLYNRGLCAISWIKDVKNLNDEEQKKLVDGFNSEFFDNLYSNEEEYIPNRAPDQSNCTIFLEIRNLITEDENHFLTLDLSEFSSVLTQKDILYFSGIQKELATYKKTSQKDELFLIDSAMEILNLKNNEDKYSFVQQINDDFLLFMTNNKKIEEKDKITLVKRRIGLFGDKISKETKYYKKLLTSSNE